MSMERSRRARLETKKVPLTWEVPAAVVGAFLFLFLVTPLGVQGVVTWLTQGTFAWPSNHLLDAYTGLAQGRFGEGLPGDVAAGLPSDPVMWALAALGELVVLGAAVVVGLWIRDLSGSDSRHGLAAGAQASEALGLARLRASAAVIRPDLYAQSRRRSRSGQQSTTAARAEGE